MENNITAHTRGCIQAREYITIERYLLLRLSPLPCIPLNGSSTELGKIPLLIGVIVIVLLGEVIRHVSHSRATERARALGIELPKAKMGPDVDRRRPRRPRRPKSADES